MAGNHKAERVAARRRPRAALIAGPLAVLATGGAVGLGVLASQPAQDPFALDSSVIASAVDDPARELGSVSRGGGGRGDGDDRQVQQAPVVAPLSPVDKLLTRQAVTTAVGNADTKLWTTTDLNLWTRPDGKAEQVGLIDGGKHVLVTGRSMNDREEIVIDGKSRWVTTGYLSSEEPFSVGGACTNGTSVSAGVSPNIVKVHDAVCAEFPEITTYGTFRGDGEHAQGIAVDIMVSGDRGWQVAEFVRKYYAELGVSYVIYSQNIWSVQRSGEGWRGMEDRGSTTANHYDHVHVTTYF